MTQSSLLSDWEKNLTDPYSVLGVSITADDRRVQKRYRDIAKQLHPDKFIHADEATQELSTKLLARLVNPAYKKLQQEKERKENLALLRLKVRRLTRERPISPKSDLARQLLEHPASAVDVFYEQAIAHLSETQFQAPNQFAIITEQLSELNLVYLKLKMGDVGVREKRTGVISVAQVAPTVNSGTPQKVNLAPENSDFATESYDQRHYRRAQVYAKKGAWEQVVQELREAIKLKADKSEYHALLGLAYLQQRKFPGMAKVHIKRALELNPNDPLATKYAPNLGIVMPSPNGTAATGMTQKTNGVQSKTSQKVPQSQKTPNSPKKGGLFGLFGK